MQVYRGWTQDTSDIVRRRRRGPAATFASEASAAATEDDPTDESVRRRSGPMLRALPGVELCAELAALYTRVADGGDAPDEGGQGGEGGEWGVWIHLGSDCVFGGGSASACFAPPLGYFKIEYFQ